MSESYLGEIRMFGGNFPPLGWAFCDGRSLSISQYSALYSLIGTTYGGDGQTNFLVPDLRGRVPVHQGSGVVPGQQAGVESVTLGVPQMPGHSHAFLAGGTATATNPGGNYIGIPDSDKFTTDFQPGALSPQAISAVGRNQSHSNLQPYLCINFIIALEGIYPSQP